ncbi:MAG: hypothetical protein JXR07_03585 [Reichenbachiella sp.]
MTRYDIKLRRRSLTQGQIVRHKDFQRLTRQFNATSRTSNRLKLLAAVFGLIAVLGAIAFGIQRVSEKRIQNSNSEKEKFENFKRK